MNGVSLANVRSDLVLPESASWVGKRLKREAVAPVSAFVLGESAPTPVPLALAMKLVNSVTPHIHWCSLSCPPTTGAQNEFVSESVRGTPEIPAFLRCNLY